MCKCKDYLQFVKSSLKNLQKNSLFATSTKTQKQLAGIWLYFHQTLFDQLTIQYTLARFFLSVSSLFFPHIVKKKHLE